MSLSQSEIFGFASDVIGLLERERVKLISLGIDADKLIRELKQLLKDASESDARQESLKRQTREETKRTTKLVHALHMSASGDLDIVIGAFGKSSIDSKVIKRMRSKIRRRRKRKSSKKKTATE